eukprot:m.281909 g.281909  ORF g.281909 m.281909 type:complete len:64 (-) comp138100_c0_seq1:51-242(-)
MQLRRSGMRTSLSSCMPRRVFELLFIFCFVDASLSLPISLFLPLLMPLLPIVVLALGRERPHH